MLACSTESGRQYIPWPPRQHCQQTWFTRSWRIPACLTKSEVRHHPPASCFCHADRTCVGKPLSSPFEAPGAGACCQEASGLKIRISTAAEGCSQCVRARCAGLTALLRGVPARRRLFQVSPDGWRVRSKPDAVGIMRIKRAVLDFMVKPLNKDLPVSR